MKGAKRKREPLESISVAALCKFLKLVKRNFPKTFFTHGHCHDLAVALHELFGGQLWVAFADNVYDHTVLEVQTDFWDIDGAKAIYRWTEMNFEFQIEFTRWDRYSLDKLSTKVDLDRELINRIKNLYETYKNDQKH